MEKQESGSTSSGIGLGGAFGVLFVALKLLGVIDWSWLWVLAPIWGPIAFILVVLVIYVLCMLVKAVIE